MWRFCWVGSCTFKKLPLSYTSKPTSHPQHGSVSSSYSCSRALNMVCKRQIVWLTSQVRPGRWCANTVIRLDKALQLGVRSSSSWFRIKETVGIHCQWQQHTVILNELGSNSRLPLLGMRLSRHHRALPMVFIDLILFLALYLNPYAINVLYLHF